MMKARDNQARADAEAAALIAAQGAQALLAAGNYTSTQAGALGPSQDIAIDAALTLRTKSGKVRIWCDWSVTSSIASEDVTYTLSGDHSLGTLVTEIVQSASAGAKRAHCAFTKDVTGLTPGTLYTFELDAHSNGGTLSSANTSGHITVQELPE